MWNNAEHLEVYLAVPSMGAVLHTLNIRLFPDQVTYVANHAEDKVVVVDASLLAPFAALLPTFETVTHVLVAGPEAADADLSALEATGKTILRYEDALAAAEPVTEWPDIVETDAAAMCYTSGTTGNPKGVAYSHRSMYLHSMAVAMGDAMGLTPYDRILPIVPMFHANAWGLPYAAIMVGAAMVMPDRWLQSEPLTRLIAGERVTVSGAVPTIWNDILTYADSHEADLSSIRLVPCGGSAVPLGLQRALLERHGVKVLQAWGMTETSPVATIALPPVGVDADSDEGWRYRASQGRALAGVTARIVGDDGQELPRDGVAVGEIEVRGPWVTASYYKDDDPEKFRDGWLAHRRRRHPRPAGLHHPHRPGQGRHQVRRRVDLLGRPGEPPDGPPRRPRGRGGRDPRREVGRAPARHRRAARGRRRPTSTRCASTSPPSSPSGSSPTPGPSSSPSPARRSASSTRRSSARTSPTAPSTSSASSVSAIRDSPV